MWGCSEDQRKWCYTKRRGRRCCHLLGILPSPYKLGLGRVEELSRGGRRKDKTTEKDDQMKKIEDISFALTITCCLKQSRKNSFIVRNIQIIQFSLPLLVPYILFNVFSVIVPSSSLVVSLSVICYQISGIRAHIWWKFTRT